MNRRRSLEPIRAHQNTLSFIGGLSLVVMGAAICLVMFGGFTVNNSINGYCEVKGVYFDCAVINYYVQPEEKDTNTAFSIEIESVIVEDGDSVLDDMTEQELASVTTQVEQYLLGKGE